MAHTPDADRTWLRDAMDRYEQHPVHQKAVKETLMPMVRKIQVYDFVTE